MTRNLRKRHLVIWCLITGLLALLLVAARLQVPVFSGETQNVTQEK